MKTLASTRVSERAASAKEDARRGLQRVHPALRLQQAVGNQTMQKLLASDRKVSAKSFRAGLPVMEEGHAEEKVAQRNADTLASGQRLVTKANAKSAATKSRPLTASASKSESVQAGAHISRSRPAAERSAPHGSPSRKFNGTKRTKPVNSAMSFGGISGNDEPQPPRAPGLGSGQPLTPSSRRFFEEKFESDLSSVRIYAGEAAAQAAESLQATAFTIGSNIVLGRNANQPTTPQGTRLLAHELTHVLQQRIASTPSIQCQPDQAERTRRANLAAAYRSALQSRNWAQAALLLNGYNEGDISTRIRQMDHNTRVEMYAGALASMPNFHQRVTGAIEAVDTEARRVGELLFQYKSAVTSGDWPRAAELLNAFNNADIARMVPQLSLAEAQAIRGGAGSRFPRVAAAADAAIRSRALAEGLDRIRRIHYSTSVEDQATQVQEALSGVDLRQQSNLAQVIPVVQSTFGADSRAVLTTLLSRIEASLPPRQPTAADIAREERLVGLMQVGPRGPYRQYGPGVVLPVLSQAARPLLPLVEAVGNSFAGAGGFVEGLLNGLSSSLNEQQRERLANRMLQSSVLTAVFPPLFLAGTAVGVVTDVVDAVKGVYQLITNFREFVEAMKSFIGLMFSPESAAFGRAMGNEIGRSYGARIAGMIEENVFEFTFDLGRMIGPTILYIVLAFLGVPELVAASIVERLLPILRPFLERFPRLLRIIESMAVRLRERSAGTIIGRAQEARRAAAAAAIDSRIEAVLARIPTAVRSTAIEATTFDAAVAANLPTETLGLADVMRAVPADAAEFRELYRIAYNGMNNRDLWEAVLRDIAREAETVAGPPFVRPEITSKYSQAILNLAERRGQRATLLARPSPVTVVEPGVSFFDSSNPIESPFGRRFLDLGVSTSDHGFSAHMAQDLVVDRAFQNSGRYVDAERFRGMLGHMNGPGARGGNLSSQLWNALYDSQEGRLTAPETVTEMMRNAFGAGHPN